MSTLEELEHTLGEGPCVDAFTLGVPVLEPDPRPPGRRALAELQRRALSAAASAAFGFPLAIGAVRIGSLNLYADRPGDLTEGQPSDASLLAEVATHVVLAAQANAPSEGLAVELQDIGAHQLRVHQATGMVSAQLGVSAGDALAVLRASAYSSDGPSVSWPPRSSNGDSASSPDGGPRPSSSRSSTTLRLLAASTAMWAARSPDSGDLAAQRCKDQGWRRPAGAGWFSARR